MSGSPVAWGDIPNWLQAAVGLVQVGHVVWTIHNQRGSEYLDQLRSETQLDDDAIAEKLAGCPELAAVLVDGIERAMRARTTDKRWLLAKVVAAAFRGDTARLDDVAILLRTAAALEPPETRALVVIATPRPDTLPDSPIVGSIRADELAEQLTPEERILIQPIVATLIREGLVVDDALGGIGYQAAWFATPYGFRFLRFLPGHPLPDLTSVTVVGVHNDQGLLIKNLGPGPASVIAVELTGDNGRSFVPEIQLPIELGAGDRVRVRASYSIPPNGGSFIRLRWADENGVTTESERMHWRPR